jgi:hypothetical protein
MNVARPATGGAGHCYRLSQSGNTGLMKLLATAVLALALPALAASSTSASGLRGVVLIDPAYPVCPLTKPCTKPAARVWLVFSRSSRTVARTRTGGDGSYRVRLKPGAYSVTSPRRIRRGGLEPQRIAVLAGRYRQVIFKLDIGIR